MGGFTLCGPRYTFRNIPSISTRNRPRFYTNIDSDLENLLLNKRTMVLDFSELPKEIVEGLRQTRLKMFDYYIVDSQPRSRCIFRR
jgi:hypothetical protein